MDCKRKGLGMEFGGLGFRVYEPRCSGIMDVRFRRLGFRGEGLGPRVYRAQGLQV